jgi:glycosyltransferase involved in cell wall biosynthesis
MEPIKSVHVATGLITIPPNGWGAVERLTWEYKVALEKQGHTVDVKYMNDLEKWPNTIVHAHLANQALYCRDKGIPYVYSLHDHHTEWYGKDSWVFKQNLEAMKHSIISFTHAEYLIDYFDATDKLFYLPHGANTEFFTPDHAPKPHSLLMLANNGLAGDSGYDRKGFRFGIEAAKLLNLPITIAGHPDNNKFFEIHSELLDYPKLTLKLTNPTDDETRELYRSSSIFVHPSMLEAGHPNLTLMEAVACGLPIVGTYRGSKHIPGMHVIDKITTESVVDGIVNVIHNYEERRQAILDRREEYSWDNVAKILAKYYYNILKINEGYTSDRTRQLYINTYNNL